MKDFINGTDQQTMDNYVNQAPFVLEQHTVKFVSFVSDSVVSNIARGFHDLNDEFLDVVSKQMGILMIRGPH